MINIIDTRNLRASTNVQQLFNDFANAVNFDWISYERDGEDNVTKIKVSDEVYLEYTSTTSWNMVHNTTGYSTAQSSNATYYIIIITDTNVAILYAASNNLRCTVFGATKNPADDSISHGIILYSGGAIYAYTDNMIGIAEQRPITTYASSSHNTQLIPHTPINSRDIFTNVYTVMCRKSQPVTGEILMNSTDYFYLLDALAIGYTP